MSLIEPLADGYRFKHFTSCYISADRNKGQSAMEIGLDYVLALILSFIQNIAYNDCQVLHYKRFHSKCANT